MDPLSFSVNPLIDYEREKHRDKLKRAKCSSFCEPV